MGIMDFTELEMGPFSQPLRSRFFLLLFQPLHCFLQGFSPLCFDPPPQAHLESFFSQKKCSLNAVFFQRDLLIPYPFFHFFQWLTFPIFRWLLSYLLCDVASVNQTLYYWAVGVLVDVGCIIGRMGHYSTRLAISVLVIYIAYMGSAYFTQKLFRHSYPHISLNRDGSHRSHRFAYPSLLAWTSCALCAAFGLLHALSTRPRPNPIPVGEQARLGLLFTLNYLPTIHALLYVSYPVQLVAKNARYLFVVVVGVFFSRVKASRDLALPARKVFTALLVTAGTLLFMYFQGGRKGQRGGNWMGYGLLLVAVVSDALFADSQAYCKAAFRPSPWHLYTSANLWAGGMIFLFSLVSGELLPSLKFCAKHRGVIWDVALICLLQTCGQVAIYYVVGNFKQHVYPLVSTTRKVFTVVLSVLMFGHMLNSYQWLALALLALAMAAELHEEIALQEQLRQHRRRQIEEEKMVKQGGGEREGRGERGRGERGREERGREGVVRPNSPARTRSPSPVDSPYSPARRSPGRSASPLPRILISSPQ